MADSVFPVSNDVMTKAILRSWMQDGGIGDYIQSGFVMSDGGGLNVSVSAGVAMMQGVRASTTAAIVGALTAASTNHVFLTIDENVADDVILSINTTGTAPSAPYLKLGTVETDATTITALDNNVSVGIRGVFERHLYQRAAPWVTEGVIDNMSYISQTSSNTVQHRGSHIYFSCSGGSPSELFLRMAFVNFGGTANGANMAAIGTMDANDILEVVFRAVFVAAPSSANALTGIAINTNSAGSERTNTTANGIRFGLASDGNLHIATCSGAGVTDTDLGAYTLSTPVKVRIVFTKGVNVVVYVDDVSVATVTGTLPTQASAFIASTGASTNGQWKFYGGAWRFTST